MPGDVQVIDDTPDPKATSATLVIRNFYPGLTVSVSTDSGMLVDGLAYGATYQATGLPSKRLPLGLKTKLPNGTEAESGAEADFVASKRGTLLVIPDSYGRFRPRVTIDGKIFDRKLSTKTNSLAGEIDAERSLVTASSRHPPW